MVELRLRLIVDVAVCAVAGTVVMVIVIIAACVSLLILAIGVLTIHRYRPACVISTAWCRPIVIYFQQEEIDFRRIWSQRKPSDSKI